MPRRVSPPEIRTSTPHGMVTDEDDDNSSLSEQEIPFPSLLHEREAASSVRNDQLDAELENQATLTILSMTANINKNTQKTYKCAVKNWDAWCVRKGIADGCQVSERKLNSYVREEVSVPQIF